MLKYFSDCPPRLVTQTLGLLWLSQERDCAGTELFPSAIPVAQVPLRVATIGKKYKKKS